MYFYFSSSIPCALKINGIILGTIYKTVKFCDIQSESSPLIEICPLGISTGNCNFILNDDLLNKPPQNLAVTDLKGGFLIHVKSLPIVKEFSLISQKKLDNALVTVYSENGLKITIESNSDFFVESLHLQSSIAEIFSPDIDKRLLFIVFDSGHTAVYKLNGKIEKIYFDCNVNFSFDSTIRSEKNLPDIAKHKIISDWTFDGNTLASTVKEICHSPDFYVDNLADEILPYAFLEAYLANEKLLPYLTEKMGKNVDKLNYYLKNFTGIMPPPIFRKDDEIGLIYKKTDNLFEVSYCTFELKNRKIDNIKILDK